MISTTTTDKKSYPHCVLPYLRALLRSESTLATEIRVYFLLYRFWVRKRPTRPCQAMGSFWGTAASCKCEILTVGLFQWIHAQITVHLEDARWLTDWSPDVCVTSHRSPSMLPTGAASSYSTEKRAHDVRMSVDNKHKQVVPMEIPVGAKWPLGHTEKKK